MPSAISRPLSLIQAYGRKIRKYGLRKSARLFSSIVWNSISGPVRKRIMGSFSQRGEDLILDRLMGYKKGGFYVDIGASSPYLDSNTARFYKRGWTGINLEPNYAKFRAFPSDRPRDTNLNLGVGQSSKAMDFYVVDPPQLSSFSMEEAKRAVKMGHKIIETRKVGVAPLREILAKHAAGRKIDFMSIDTEGYEMQVLHSNDWGRFRPNLICIEYVHYSDGSEVKEIFEFLTSAGYVRVYANGLNSIYQDSKAQGASDF